MRPGLYVADTIPAGSRVRLKTWSSEDEIKARN